MLSYLIRRITYTLPIMLGVALVCFALVHLAPGDPLVSILPPDASQELAAQMREPLPYNHRFQKQLHAVVSCDKARRVLGFAPHYDFAAGHRHTYAWFLAQGLERMEQPLNDPTWNVSWDFEREARLIETLRKD